MHRFVLIDRLSKAGNRKGSERKRLAGARFVGAQLLAWFGDVHFDQAMDGVLACGEAPTIDGDLPLS
jgi:hypothetical protein